jgi:hypothetical protein
MSEPEMICPKPALDAEFVTDNAGTRRAYSDATDEDRFVPPSQAGSAANLIELDRTLGSGHRMGIRRLPNPLTGASPGLQSVFWEETGRGVKP